MKRKIHFGLKAILLKLLHVFQGRKSITYNIAENKDEHEVHLTAKKFLEYHQRRISEFITTKQLEINCLSQSEEKYILLKQLDKLRKSTVRSMEYIKYKYQIEDSDNKEL